jgi:hypothetical protein
MQENGIVLWRGARLVFHAESGRTSVSWMVVTLYPQPVPLFVLTREILTDNVSNATVFYMEIPGTTLEECKENMEKGWLQILKPLSTLQKNGRGRN